MKKLFFILIVSLLAAGGLFAELTIEPSFKAEAELKFGVDFDDPAGDDIGISTGFSSSAKFTAGLTLRDKANEEFGEGETYGWIKIEDFEISLEAESGSGYNGGKDRTQFTLENGAALALGGATGGATITLPIPAGSPDGTAPEVVLVGDKDTLTYQANINQDGTLTLASGTLTKEDGTTQDLAGATLTGATLTLADGTVLNIVDEDDEGTPLVVKWGDIEAHLKFGENVYLNILSGTFDTDQSAFSDAVNGRTLKRTGDKVVEVTELGTAIDPGTKVALGVTNINLGGPATIELGIQSEKTYNENFDNTYGISLKVDHVIIPDLLSHDLIAVLDLNNKKKIQDPTDATKTKDVDANNYAVGYNLTPEFSVGDFGIQIPVGIDFVYYGADEKFDLAAKLAVRFDWSSMDGALDTERDTFSETDKYDLASGVELGGRLLMPGGEMQALNTYLRVFDDEGDKGIIPILGVEALVDFDYYLAGALKDTIDLGVGLYAKADLGIVSPYVGIAYANYDLSEENDSANQSGADTTFRAKVGAEVSSIVDNVTFTLDWSSGNLLLDDNVTVEKGKNLGLRLDRTTTSKLGQVTLGTKISF